MDIIDPTWIKSYDGDRENGKKLGNCNWRNEAKEIAHTKINIPFICGNNDPRQFKEMQKHRIIYFDRRVTLEISEGGPSPLFHFFAEQFAGGGCWAYGVTADVEFKGVRNSQLQRCQSTEYFQSQQTLASPPEIYSLGR